MPPYWWTEFEVTFVEFVEKVDAEPGAGGPVTIAALFMPVLMKTSVVAVSVFMHMNVGMSCSLVACTTVLACADCDCMLMCFCFSLV